MHFIGITKAEDNFCDFGLSDAYITMEKDFDTALKNAYEKYAKTDGIENIIVMTLTHNTDFSSLFSLIGDDASFVECAKQIAKHCEWNFCDNNAYLVSEKINDTVLLGELIIAQTKTEALNDFIYGYSYPRGGKAQKVTPQSLIKKLPEFSFANTYSIVDEALNYLQLKEGV